MSTAESFSFTVLLVVIIGLLYRVLRTLEVLVGKVRVLVREAQRPLREQEEKEIAELESALADATAKGEAERAAKLQNILDDRRGRFAEAYQD